jgi:hypothetical protein
VPLASSASSPACAFRTVLLSHRDVDVIDIRASGARLEGASRYLKDGQTVVSRQRAYRLNPGVARSPSGLCVGYRPGKSGQRILTIGAEAGNHPVRDVSALELERSRERKLRVTAATPIASHDYSCLSTAENNVD